MIAGDRSALLGWCVLWLILFLLSQNHAPNAAMMALQTSIMISMSVAAFYNYRLTSKRLTSRTRLVATWVTLVAISGFVSAFVIGKAYDVFARSAAGRFTLRTNTVLDIAVVAFNVLVMSFVLRSPGPLLEDI